jgi:hypothetical protein
MMYYDVSCIMMAYAVLYCVMIAFKMEKGSKPTNKSDARQAGKIS